MASADSDYMKYRSRSAAYADAYFPLERSRLWFTQRQTMPTGEGAQAIAELLKEVCRDEAGFYPDHLRSLEDFTTKVSFGFKEDLRASQAQTSPLGDHDASGTTGRPSASAVGRNDRNTIANANARIMHAQIRAESGA